MKHFDTSALTVPQVHGLLVGSIGPRPIAFASTVDAEGRPNLSPFSFFNCFGANPPTLIFSPARRGRDNTTKHTYHNVKAVPEVVINVVSYSMVEQTNVASAEYPEGVNEFQKAGFTPIASEKVKPLRVKESPVQFECIVKQVIETGTGGGAGNLVICEVVMIHVAESVLDENGRIDQRKIDLVGRIGGHFYTRAHGDALFELPQPTSGICVGADALPKEVRESHVLTGNDIGKLAAVLSVPDETSVNEYKLTELSDIFIDLQNKPSELLSALHSQAHQLILDGELEDAWRTVLAYNAR